MLRATQDFDAPVSGCTFLSCSSDPGSAFLCMRQFTRFGFDSFFTSLISSTLVGPLERGLRFDGGQGEGMKVLELPGFAPGSPTEVGVVAVGLEL